MHGALGIMSLTIAIIEIIMAADDTVVRCTEWQRYQTPWESIRAFCAWEFSWNNKNNSTPRPTYLSYNYVVIRDRRSRMSSEFRKLR
jgi:hypothetical protein